MSPDELRAEVERLHLAPLSADEFSERVARAVAELDGEEGESIAALIRWFRRRYPTPRERLAYTRRKHAEWTRKLGPPRPATQT